MKLDPAARRGGHPRGRPGGCVLDGSLPPVQADRDAVDLLRRSERPVLFVANKVDGQQQELR